MIDPLHAAALPADPQPTHPPARPGGLAGAHIGGSRNNLREEIHLLLRVRLRAVALFCLIGCVAFGVGQLFIDISASYKHYRVLVGVHLLSIAGLAAILLYLSPRHPRSERALRVVEGGTFLLLCGFLWALLVCETWDMAYPPGDKRVYITNTGAPWMIAVFGYSLFIPNPNWRRTLVVNSLLTLIPVLTLSAMMLLDSEVRREFQNSNFVHLLFDFLLVLGAATYGSWLMNYMHKEAVVARQLGQYHLGRQLGRGGMGEVYLAEHQMLKRPCAIKIIRTDQRGSAAHRERFEKEVQHMAQLSHWNTVEIYDYGSQKVGAEGEIFYYAMEYLPGWTVHDLLEEFGPLPPERVIHLLRQICDALHEAHSLGLLHRDIKPANIVVSQRGGVCDVGKLLDFGLVKKLGDASDLKLTQDGVVSGTPEYMSPEQATGQEVDGRSDLYALGALGYFMLTGRPPFHHGDAMQVLISHRDDPVPPLSQLRPGIPFDLEQVIERALAKRPEDRFESARAMEAALARCKLAGKWTVAQAEAWWRAHLPTAPLQPIRDSLEASTVRTDQAAASTPTRPMERPAGQAAGEIR